MAGVAEEHEPLAVEGARHLIEHADALLAVLDEVIVRREDAHDAALLVRRRPEDGYVIQIIPIQRLLGTA
jgi:hypothetical protein